MSGRRGGRNGGCGHIAMTQAKLTDLINTRVAEALAAYQAGQQVQQNPHHPPVCTFKTFIDCKPQTFSGTEGAVGLLRWFENAESVFVMCNCPVGDRVKYAAGTLEDGALTWWNAQVQLLGIEAANATTWDDFKELMREEYCPHDEIQKLENEYYDLKMVGSEIEAYVKRSYELADLCPNLSRPMSRRIELFIKGLPPRVKGLATAANLNNLTQIVRLAHKIVDQEVESNSLLPRVSATTTTATTATTPATDSKRKWSDVDKASNSVQSQKKGRYWVTVQARVLMRENYRSAVSATIIIGGSVLGHVIGATKWGTWPEIVGFYSRTRRSRHSSRVDSSLIRTRVFIRVVFNVVLRVTSSETVLS
ncbi:putative retrotransposon gag domain-containing protein [Helianthus annuus]|nr:putative retrotransposon gag domain-containing protein [Helianthus annuus]